MKSSLLRLASAIAPCLLLIACAEHARTAAQRDREVQPSHNGQYEIIFDSTDAENNAYASHRLLLRDRDGHDREIMRFDRHVSTIWSPDGRRIAITDFGGSDFSRTYIYNVEQHTLIDETGTILEASGLVQSQTELDHLYPQIVRWESTSSVHFAIDGYGSGASVTREGTYILAD